MSLTRDKKDQEKDIQLPALVPGLPMDSSYVYVSKFESIKDDDVLNRYQNAPRNSLPFSYDSLSSQFPQQMHSQYILLRLGYRRSRV